MWSIYQKGWFSLLDECPNRSGEYTDARLEVWTELTTKDTLRGEDLDRHIGRAFSAGDQVAREAFCRDPMA